MGAVGHVIDMVWLATVYIARLTSGEEEGYFTFLYETALHGA
jgi:hypothetical protein